jgi:hypothetical protein
VPEHRQKQKSIITIPTKEKSPVVCFESAKTAAIEHASEKRAGEIPYN